MTWNEKLSSEYTKPYYKSLFEFVESEYKSGNVYPPKDLILNALNLTSYENVKCVIIGQDPYQTPGAAMGLSFSVPDGTKIPPSLINIYKELNYEFGYPIPSTGNLTYWAKQGVLLLNSILTVRAHQSASHRGRGWEQYTDAIIKAVDDKPEPVVFMLWGNYAKNKAYLITNQKHLILKAVHPSPYSADKGFFGCGHFKACNEYLMSNNVEPIDWQVR